MSRINQRGSSLSYRQSTLKTSLRSTTAGDKDDKDECSFDEDSELGQIISVDSEEAEVKLEDLVSQLGEDKEASQLHVVKRIQKFPQIWLSKCPLTKINHNLHEITQFQSKQQYPKLFPLADQPPLYFQTEQQKERFYHRALVGKYFCQLQQKKISFRAKSRLKHLNQIYFQRIQTQEPPRFKPMAETVLTQTCRKVQQFIIERLKINIQKLSRIEYREIIVILMYSSDYLSKQMCETLCNFIKLTYRLGNVTLSRVSQVIKLYKSMQLSIRVRIQRRLDAIGLKKDNGKQLQSFRQLSFKTQLKTIWNYEYEKLMLDCYRKNQNFGYIRQQFQLNFPDYAKVFNTNQLKDRFSSIIRIALKIIRKGVKSMQERGIQTPKMLGLNQKNFKQILKVKKTLGVRLWLVDIYERQEASDEEIVSIVQVINDFLQMKLRDREASQIWSQSRAQEDSFMSFFDVEADIKLQKMSSSRDIYEQSDVSKVDTKILQQGEFEKKSKPSLQSTGVTSAILVESNVSVFTGFSSQV